MRSPKPARTDESSVSDQRTVMSKERLDDWLDDALADTFPASDPVASPPSGGGSPVPSDQPARIRSLNNRDSKEPKMSAHVAPDETIVVVRGSGLGFAQEISARAHRLSADEPIPNGGTDTGPTPYDLLLAALGS